MMEKIRRNDLNEESKFILEESRIVVPGIQALFGFQLMAVFNNGFSEQLSSEEQWVHLTATFLVVLSMILVMAPAALHRVSEPGCVSFRFVKFSTRFLEMAMFTLSAAVGIDFYLIARIITGSEALSYALGAFITFLCLGTWYLFPKFLKPHINASPSN
jgi:hypothetical protein